jgi:hypothetical protein
MPIVRDRIKRSLILRHLDDLHGVHPVDATLLVASDVHERSRRNFARCKQLRPCIVQRRPAAREERGAVVKAKDMQAGILTAIGEPLV